jgi:hypothetical protein
MTELPPLPAQAMEMLEYDHTFSALYTAKQMREYAAAAIEAYKKSLVPVAWTTMPDADDWDFVSGELDPNGMLDGTWFPVYRLDKE